MTSTIDMIRALVGRDIQFTAEIEEKEWYAEAGMRAVVTGVTVQDDDPKDPQFKVFVSFAKFDEYNKQFESSNWTTNEGPLKSARETGNYKVADWFYADDNVMKEMFPLDDATATLLRFFETDKVANPDLTYVAWLEKIAATAFHFTKD